RSAPAAGGVGRGLVDDDPAPHPAGRGSRPLEFTRLKARCRSWQEVDAAVGHAAVELLAEQSAEHAPPFEAHLIPVPDRTPVIAVLLLWNRSLEPVTVSSVSYAPEAATTDRVLAAVGRFEQYQVWEDYLFERAGTTRSPPATSGGDNRREAAAMPGWARTAPSTLPTEMNATDLHLRIAAGGIAVIAFDRGSFLRSRAATTLLSYPVVEYLVDGVPHRVGLTIPLYSTSLRGGQDFGLQAVLHSLFAASSPVGPAALLDEDLFGED
ncbi:MAG TPA: hypothetical protein VFD39_03255, partial [Trueperaceae bacterium]|nr:hypothetical protein [Trueperaceae bacterium]